MLRFILKSGEYGIDMDFEGFVDGVKNSDPHASYKRTACGANTLIPRPSFEFARSGYGAFRLSKWPMDRDRQPMVWPVRIANPDPGVHSLTFSPQYANDAPEPWQCSHWDEQF